MASILKYNGAVVRKRSHTFFGPTQKGDVGAIVFYWDTECWTYLDHNEIWVVPNDKAIDDPVSEILPSKGTRRKSLVAFTQKGESLDIPPDQHSVVTFMNRDYLVAHLPTIVKVPNRGLVYNVLCYYGYHQSSKTVVLCTLNGGGLAYGAEVLNGQVFTKVDEDLVFEKSPRPSFSTGTVVGTQKPVQVLRRELEVYKCEERSVLSSGSGNDDDPQVADAIKQLQEKIAALEKSLEEQVKKNREHDPTQQSLSIVVEVTDGQIKRALRRKSSVAKTLGDKVSQQELSFDPFAEARKAMRPGPDGSLIMPTAAYQGPPAELKPTLMPTIKREQVEDDTNIL